MEIWLHHCYFRIRFFQQRWKFRCWRLVFLILRVFSQALGSLSRCPVVINYISSYSCLWSWCESIKVSWFKYSRHLVCDLMKPGEKPGSEALKHLERLQKSSPNKCSREDFHLKFKAEKWSRSGYRIKAMFWGLFLLLFSVVQFGW